jgi:hypothetical protein
MAFSPTINFTLMLPQRADDSSRIELDQVPLVYEAEVRGIPSSYSPFFTDDKEKLHYVSGGPFRAEILPVNPISCSTNLLDSKNGNRSDNVKSENVYWVHLRIGIVDDQPVIVGVYKNSKMGDVNEFELVSLSHNVRLVDLCSNDNGCES